MQVRLFPEDDRSTDRAVSPVIGVILMVAITVILAAVIGTFVLNLSGSVSANVDGAATVQTGQNESANVVTINSMGSEAKGVYCIGDGKNRTTWTGPQSNITVGNEVGASNSCPDGYAVVVQPSSGSDKDAKTIASDIDADNSR